MSVGPITALWSSPALTLVAGEAAVAVLGPDGRFRTLPDQASPLLQGVTGIVQDAAGGVWLNGNRGVVHLSLQALTQSVQTGLPAPSLRLYDTMDGLPGIAQQATPVPSALAAADGLLWFATNQGLAWLDPSQTYRNPTAPTVAITEVVANDRPYPLQAALRLPKWSDRLRIGYEAVSLTRPERVRFRYRLDGVDAAWQDAGNRTEAFYTNLAPGRYRFEVAAANNDGVWNARGDTLDVVIEPAFVQTWQFKLCCVLAAVAALAVAWRLRTRHVAGRLRARLEERYRERERIARELHDTLLQGTQGLILRLHTASRSLAWDDPAGRNWKGPSNWPSAPSSKGATASTACATPTRCAPIWPARCSRRAKPPCRSPPQPWTCWSMAAHSSCARWWPTNCSSSGAKR